MPELNAAERRNSDQSIIIHTLKAIEEKKNQVLFIVVGLTFQSVVHIVLDIGTTFAYNEPSICLNANFVRKLKKYGYSPSLKQKSQMNDTKYIIYSSNDFVYNS